MKQGISIQRALVYIGALILSLVGAFGSFIIGWKYLGFALLGLGLVGALSLVTVPIYTREELRARAIQTGRGLGRMIALVAIIVATATVVEVIRDPSPPPRIEAWNYCKYKSRAMHEICRINEMYRLANEARRIYVPPEVRGSNCPLWQVWCN